MCYYCINFIAILYPRLCQGIYVYKCIYICLIKKNFNDNSFDINLPIIVKYYLTESIVILGEGILCDHLMCSILII